MNIILNQLKGSSASLFRRYGNNINRFNKLIPNGKFHLTSNKYNNLPKTPDLIYIPHFMRWLKTKLRFKYLRKTWDPEFSEGAFIYGSTHAICRITEIIKSGNEEEFDGLLTPVALEKLKLQIKRLTKVQRDVIILKPDDIKILIPLNVSFNNKTKRECKIGLRVLALKWHEQSTNLYRLVLVAIQSEFVRNYSLDLSPEWTISKFKILECAVLSKASNFN